MNLYNGLIHNINDSARYKYTDFTNTMNISFYYQGNRLLHFNGKPIKSERDFTEGKPYYLENDKDGNKIYFDIKELRKSDLRMKKLDRILKNI